MLFYNLLLATLLGYTVGEVVVTTPNRYILDRNESVCIEIHNLDNLEPNMVNLKLEAQARSWVDDEQPIELMVKMFTMYPGEVRRCENLLARSEPLEGRFTNLVLYVNVTQGNYQFSDHRAIGYSTVSPIITFIQTDKPVYKPGQTVRFRVLTLDSELKPLTENIDQVFITTPSGTRVEQWRDVVPMKGLGDFSMELSEELELGEWSINVEHNGVEEVMTFKVEEYVLPKFEVTITPPSFLTLESPDVHIQVCGKYTYGESVNGRARVVVCYEEGYNWRYYRRSAPQPCHLKPLLDLDQDGCVYVNLTKAEVGYDSVDDFVYGTNLKIDASVMERDTNIELNATTAVVPFYEHDITVGVVGRDSFKPGIPFNAKGVVKYQDGKPAPGKLIEVSVNNFRDGEAYKQNYTTDSMGAISFSIPPVLEEKSQFDIQLTAIEYPKNRWGYGQPGDSHRVTSWWSPTGSYLQFDPIEGKLDCSAAELRLTYTTNEAANIQLEVTVVGPGDIAMSTRHDIMLKTQYPVGSANNQTNQWDKTDVENSYWWRPIPYLYYFDDVVYVDDDMMSTGSSMAEGIEPETTPEPESEPGPEPETEPTKAPRQRSTPSVAKFYGIVTLPLDVLPRFSPESKLLVYYVRTDGEVISEQITLDVKSCTANKVSLDWSVGKGLPGSPVTMSLSASPDSLCAYGTVDKSVFLHGGNNALTLEKAIGELRNYILTEWSGTYSTDTYCQTKLEEQEKSQKGGKGKRSSPMYHYRGGAYSNFNDALTAFKSSGLVVMTDLTLETRPCERRTYPEISYSMVDDVGLPGRAVNMMRGQPDIAQDAVMGVADNSDSSTVSKLSVRQYFPETWLWDLVTLDDSGMLEIPSELPHTITEWVGNAICINENDGLGISPQASVVTFQHYFLSMNLPYSIVRGEIAPVSVSVFNYLDECLPIRVSMKASREFRVRSEGGKRSHDVCVCGKDFKLVEYEIESLIIGEMNITVTSASIDNNQGGTLVCAPEQTLSSENVVSDAVVRPLVVKAEGAPRTVSSSEFVCLEDGLSKRIEFDFPFLTDPDMVEDSLRGYVSVVGDVMGPALDNLDNLLRMPYGCGEQNMVGFAPNIYVMQYLEAAGRESQEVRAKAVRHMKAGYQRELNYKHQDASFSAFGPGGNEDGSTWLTAFVVKCFAQAQPYIAIDAAHLNDSLHFFRTNQNPDGCFEKKGMVHSKYMKGGQGKDENPATLTAYVLIAILEAGVPVNDRMVESAVMCLDLAAIDTVYSQALISYAYSLYNPFYQSSRQAFTNLQLQASYDNGMRYWKASNDIEEEQNDVWYWRPVSADVETTAYALLTMMNMLPVNDQISEAVSTVKWMAKQRNPWGGFASTQDTVLGLQALAAYASLVYSNGLDASISVSNPTDGSFASFRVNQENSLVQLSADMPTMEELTLQASGQGCFLFQANFMYNVMIDEAARIDAFPTTADDFRSSLINDPCKARKLHMCTRYAGGGSESNMAVAEVKMVSGWQVDKSSLKAAQKTGTVARYDVEKDGTVQLYFNKLTRSNVCLEMELRRVNDVQDAKPAVVTVYDYYEKKLWSEIEYEVSTSSCKVPTGTKEDLPEIDMEAYLSTDEQARQPADSIPPWLRSNIDDAVILDAETTTDGNTNCPICLDTAEEMDHTAICGFSKAYKTYWRAHSRRPMRIFTDLRPSHGKTRIFQYIRYEIPEDCICSTLTNAEKGDKLIIMGQWTDTPVDSMTLDSEVVVAPLSKALESKLTKASRKCDSSITVPLRIRFSGL